MSDFCEIKSCPTAADCGYAGRCLKAPSAVAPSESRRPGVGSGALSGRWSAASKTPRRKGWYITRTKDGFISWRAWGNGAWWKQIKGGWIEWFDGDGAAMRFDWQPRSRQSIDLDSDKLPDLA